MDRTMKKVFILVIVGLSLLTCKKNQAPVISNMECTTESRKAGTVFTLKVTASDEDGDLLTYHWTCDEGTFLTTTNIREVQWQSPVTGAGKTFTISVVVSDWKNSVTREIKLLLGEPDLGSVEGHVFYTNFNIPVAGAMVTIGDKATATDTDGYFVLAGTPAVECKLKVAKQSFTVSELTVHVPANDTLTVNPEITSVNFTTKLSGIVTDPGGRPVGSAQVVVLNPDGTESKLITTTISTGFYRLWYIPFGNRTIVVTKPETDDTRFIDLKQTVELQELESQLNLTIQTLLLRGEFSDTRDNHIYQYKTIGNATWMIENLAYLPQVSPPAQGSTQEALYYVYGYQGTEIKAAKATDNYEKYGVLYNWPAASKACPSGWHLPSGVAWDALAQPYESQAAKGIKSTSGWAEHGNGDNSTGFSAIPGGGVYANGTFYGIDENAYFWTSSLVSGHQSYRYLSYMTNYVYSLTCSERIGYSVRCIRDN